jgi:cold shock CspA family protein
MPIGKIDMWFPDRGYGFIRGDGHERIFVHRNALMKMGRDSLEIGTIVEYESARGPKGLYATIAVEVER